VGIQRIIDNIPRVIDRNFIGKLVDRIQTVLYSELQIGTEEGLELAANLMAEDPGMALRREDLEAKSGRLTDISAKLFRTL
jgi:Dynamin GTPase effector domain